MSSGVDKFLVDSQSTIRDVMECIDKNTKGIALIVDEHKCLLATVSDGDIRRAILAGITTGEEIGILLNMKHGSKYPEPITAASGTERGEIISLMHERTIRQVPEVDEDGRVVGLVTSEELVPEEVLPLQAVVMAGGFGKRLRPLTDDMPKPMLPVGGRPLLERTIEQLRDAGIREVSVTTHYMADKITDHFKDGDAFGVNLNYVSEDEPLGTAGAVGLMPEPTGPVLVMNGDLLTGVDFRAMLKFHNEHQAKLTVGVRQYDLQVPYGVLTSEGPLVKELKEKPTFGFLVNAGIYLMDPSVHALIPNGKFLNMTDLINHLLEAGEPVVNFPIVEYWLDIGRHEDYETAQEFVQESPE